MDGVPVSYAPYGQPQLSLAPVSLGNLESVDVIRGAGSVRYGPQNVGGIINFVTRAIPKTFAAEASVGTEIYSRSEEHTSELQSQSNLVCRLLLEKKNQSHHTLVLCWATGPC